MAKQNIQKGKRARTLTKRKKKVSWEFPLNRMNFYYLLAGIGFIILGYLLMATGITEQAAVPDGKWNNPMAVTIAPVLLVIGYCIVIPLGIFKFFGKKTEEL